MEHRDLSECSILNAKVSEDATARRSGQALPLEAAGRTPCSRICSRTNHNYLDGAGQNSTIWTVAEQRRRRSNA